MFAIGNEEIDKASALSETITCYLCGKKHRVRYGYKVLPDGSKIKSRILAFFKCKGKSYLCGINGKDLRRHHA